ncbi:RDD family protein [Priestia aryabhattai]|uniref:RDD family protein n=1 Tax=Priestia TaxID=2800373 RepID=UPI002880C7B0|nr:MULTISPECIES: RDD family protein [Priestia]MDT0149880.1 RDD family protein [Priestia aryabhattai]MDT0155433.1 RDD family protein [Priestia aryabhattai]MED5121584.1 RDD family protein [Priestia megaterium]
MNQVIKPAGFWIRLLGNLLDGIIISIPLGLISFLITGDFDGDDPVTSLIGLIYAVAVPILWYGYSVGKRIVGVRIVKVNGKKLGIGAMLLRVLVAGIVYALTLGIALIVSVCMVVFRKDKRSLHDMMAGTYVTYAKPGEVEKDAQL